MHLPIDTPLQGGKYKIVRFISSGGFGCTYEAEHVMLKKRVAIKEFFVKDFCNREEATGSVSLATQSKVGIMEKLKTKFVEEARAVFQMHHPNIVRVTDVFEERGTAYYVMDYIDGESLHDIVKQRGALPEQEAVTCIMQIAEALQYVHSLNRLHLDVKPGNIMIDKNGKAILIDFGASKHYDDKSGENTSTLLGINTKGYAPLEQVSASFTSFSPATDIYAVGATLYNLLTGITPPSPLGLVSDEETLPPLPHTVSEPVRNAVNAAMRLKKRDRPQSVDEFVSMLKLLPTITSDAETELDVNNVRHHKEQKTKVPVVNKDNLQKKSFFAKHPWLTTLCCTCIIAVIVFRFLHPQSNTPIILSNTINGHEYVDLGLSVKWATCNIGAESPSDYGDYFAWGEIAPKSEYTRENSLTYGKNLVSIEGNPTYDAATVNWGGTWRLPTRAELDELMNGDKCKWEWTVQGRHNGYKITGPNGNSIFLPAAGGHIESSLYEEWEEGVYWSGTTINDSTFNAQALDFTQKGTYKKRANEEGMKCICARIWAGRRWGLSIRPVSD